MITKTIKRITKTDVLYTHLGNICLVLMITLYFAGFAGWVLMIVGGIALVFYTIQVLLEVRQKRANVKSL